MYIKTWTKIPYWCNFNCQFLVTQQGHIKNHCPRTLATNWKRVFQSGKIIQFLSSVMSWLSEQRGKLQRSQVEFSLGILVDRISNSEWRLNMNLSEHNREFDESDNAAVTESSIGFFICAINAPMCLASLFGNAAVLTAILEDAFTALPRTHLAYQPCFNRLCRCFSRPTFVHTYLSELQAMMGGKLSTKQFSPFTPSQFGTCVVFRSLHSQQWQLIAFSVAFKLHLRYHVAVTHTRAALVIALIWTVSGCISSMRLWNRITLYLTVAVTTLLCLLGSFVAYWRIFRVVRRYQILVHCQESVRARGKQHRMMSLLKKSIWNTFIYCIFFLCNTPHVSFTVVSFAMERWWFPIVAIGDFTSTVVFLNISLSTLYCTAGECVKSVMQ